VVSAGVAVVGCMCVVSASIGGVLVVVGCVCVNCTQGLVGLGYGCGYWCVGDRCVRGAWNRCVGTVQLALYIRLWFSW
jgi:hypothetical protein